MGEDDLRAIWDWMEAAFDGEHAKGVNARVQFLIEGGGAYAIEIKNQKLSASLGLVENPRLTLSASIAVFNAIFKGELDPNLAFFQGKLDIQGDKRLALQLKDFFNRKI